MNKLEKKLVALHEMLCDDLIERLKNGEETDRDGNPAKLAPATLNVIRQFLKDNNIDGALDDDSPLADLMSELPDDFKKSFGASKQ